MFQIERYLRQDSVGVVGYVVAIVGLLPVPRRAWYPRAIAVACCLVGLLFASGPKIAIGGYQLWSPYGLLFDWFPGVAAIRLPSRFLVITQLGFALLVGLGVDRLLEAFPRIFIWPVAIAAEVILLVGIGPLPPHVLHAEPSVATVPEMYKWLSGHNDGGALIELPMGDAGVASKRMLLNTWDWIPSIDGYSAYPPPTRNYLRRLAMRLPNPDAMQLLVNVVDVRWIAVHLSELSPSERVSWEHLSIPGLVQVGRWDSDILFKVVLSSTVDLRERLTSSTETLSGTPLVSVGAHCPGRLAAHLIGGEGVLPPSSAYNVALDVENAGTQPWPGFSMYPRDVVQLRAVTRLESNLQVVSVETVPLWHDIPQSTTLRIAAELRTPNAAGEYVVELGLVQDNVLLASCGVTPTQLRVQVTGAGAGRS
jgi:hypothetical protein